MEGKDVVYLRSLIKKMPNKETMDFLRKSQECWTFAHAALQSKIESFLPGTHVVATPEEIDDCVETIEKGSVTVCREGENVVLVKGEERDCHNNALMLLATGEADYACTGYALSDDGLWRHHGWGYCLDGTIVETTTPRIAYYGFIDLSKEEFDKL